MYQNRLEDLKGIFFGLTMLMLVAGRAQTSGGLLWKTTHSIATTDQVKFPTFMYRMTFCTVFEAGIDSTKKNADIWAMQSVGTKKTSAT